MTFEDDALLRQLAALPAGDASTARVERIRRRCVAGMGVGAGVGLRRAWRALEPAAALALGVLYLVATWLSVGRVG